MFISISPGIGDHEIILEYDPAEFKIGMLISCTVIIIIFAARKIMFVRLCYIFYTKMNVFLSD